MTTDNECPCKDCITLSICQNKTYVYLTQDCQLILDHLYYNDIPKSQVRRRDFSRKVVEMINYMKPHEWCVNVLDDGFAEILVRGRHYGK